MFRPITVNPFLPRGKIGIRKRHGQLYELLQGGKKLAGRGKGQSFSASSASNASKYGYSRQHQLLYYNQANVSAIKVVNSVPCGQVLFFALRSNRSFKERKAKVFWLLLPHHKKQLLFQ
jgi:hypothetical protein